jgi:hypothetical protein
LRAQRVPKTVLAHWSNEHPTISIPKDQSEHRRFNRAMTNCQRELEQRVPPAKQRQARSRARAFNACMAAHGHKLPSPSPPKGWHAGAQSSPGSPDSVPPPRMPGPVTSPSHIGGNNQSPARRSIPGPPPAVRPPVADPTSGHTPSVCRKLLGKPTV